MYNLDCNMSNTCTGTGCPGIDFKEIVPISFDGKRENFLFNPVEMEPGMERGMLDGMEKTGMISGRACAHCAGNQVYNDEKRGETVCLRCGSVIDHHVIDSRGVRIYTQADVEEKVHAEPFKAGLRPLLKFTTGTPDEKRRARTNNRIEWKYKKVMQIRCELSKLKTMIPIPKDVEDLTMTEVERLFQTDILRGRYAMATGIAMLYWACLELNSSLRLNDITGCYRHDEDFIKQIRASVKILQIETDKKFVPKKDQSRFVTLLCNKLNLPQATCTRTIQIIKAMKTHKIIISGNPAGFIGGCLLESCKETVKDVDARHMQGRIAGAIGMTEVTIRRRAKQVREYMAQIDATVLPPAMT